MDMAIVSGRVADSPGYVTNEQKVRCVFRLCLELEKKRDPQFRGESPTEDVFTTVMVVTDPDLTERCRTFLRKEDEIMVIGEFGFHKQSLKMRAFDIGLPPLRKAESMEVPKADLPAIAGP